MACFRNNQGNDSHHLSFEQINLRQRPLHIMAHKAYTLLADTLHIQDVA